MQDETEITSTELSSGFPLLFTREEFKQDILRTMLVLANQANFVFAAGSTFDGHAESTRRVWSLLSDVPLVQKTSLSDPDLGPDELGITFADIESIGTANTLLQLYDYGVQGILDTSMENLDDCECFASWMSRILYDLSRSMFLLEWSEYAGEQTSISIKNCVYICELANARLMLEGAEEGFFLEDRDSGALSIHQMALLSGMTEASIRTLANPKRKNRLITENFNGQTIIESEHGKVWLKSKGRYVTIKKVRNSGSDDFTKRKFQTVSEFERAIECRQNYLREEMGLHDLDTKIKETGLKLIPAQILDSPFFCDVIGEDQLLNTELMQRLGFALELPPVQFALRAAETVIQEKLRAIERKLKLP